MSEMEFKAQLVLATVYQVKGDLANAEKHLRAAVIRSMAAGDLEIGSREGFPSESKKLARKLGDLWLAYATPTMDELREAGFVELTPGEAYQKVVGLGLTQRFFFTDGDAKYWYGGLSIQPTGLPGEPYRASMRVRSVGGGDMQGGRQSFNLEAGEHTRLDGYGRQRVQYTIRPVPGKDDLDVTITPTVEKR